MNTLSASLAAALLALASTPLFADMTYTCNHGGSERIISVVYSNPGETLPCEVTYTKNNETQSLWRADNVRDYCEEQAEAFVEKQRGWGWSCSGPN